jgi:hypothetical protein
MLSLDAGGRDREPGFRLRVAGFYRGRISMAHTVSTVSPRAAKAWSPEDETKLSEMRAAGKSLVVIAKALGRTEASVGSRACAIRRRMNACTKA